MAWWRRCQDDPVGLGREKLDAITGGPQVVCATPYRWSHTMALIPILHNMLATGAARFNIDQGAPDAGRALPE